MPETPEERMARLMGGAAAPAAESPEARMTRLMGGGASTAAVTGPSQADIVAARANAFGDVTPESMGQMRDQAEAAPADDETINRLLESQGHNQRVEADIAKYKAELDHDSFPGIFKKAPSEQAMAFAQMGEEGYRKAERALALSRMGGVPSMGAARRQLSVAESEARAADEMAKIRQDENPILRYGARLAVGAKEQLENAGAYVRESIVRPFFPESADAMTRSAAEYGMSEEGKAIVREDTKGALGAVAEMAGQTAAFIPQVALGGVPGAAAVSAAAAGGDAMAGVETAAFLTMAGGLTKLFGGASESVVRQVLAESGAMTAAGVATRLGFHGDAGTLQQAGVDALSGLAFGVMGGNARAKESAARFKSALEMGKTVEAAAKDAGIPMDRLNVPVPPEPMADSRFMAETARPMATNPPGVVVPRPESPMPGVEAPKIIRPGETVRPVEPAADRLSTPEIAPQSDVSAPVEPRTTEPAKAAVAPAVEPVRPVAEAPRAEPAGGVSVKNEAVTASRAARGLDPIEKSPAQTFEGWNEQAAEVLKANPNKPQELIEEFTRKPRAHTPVETAVLTSHLRTLENARKAADADVIKAAESGNLDAVAEAKARSAAISDQYMTAAEVATTAAGSEAGRSLVSRKMVMAEDFSLLAMETRRRVANDGERLTEKQAAETKALHEKLAKATADLEAYQARLESLQKRGAAAKEAVVRDATYGKKNTLVTVEAYEQTRAALREKLSRLSVNPFDPAILADLAKIGAFHVEAGLRNFAAWSKAMLDDLGEKVGPHLKDVWKAAQTEVGLPFTKAKESLAATTKEGRKVTENATAVQKIAEHFVRSGVKDRSELVEKVHEVLQEFSPGITYRQTMDAISGYGVFKALNSDPAKVRLREMKAELQQLSKLEDMASGKAPSKTGVERQAPSDAARELMKKVNEAKKRGGYEVKDPATQLKTALDATKTRLTHEIADLERQIASKTKDVNDRTPLALDAEAAALKERRDALKQQFDETFGKPGLTDAQRIEAAIKATEKSIAEYERRVATGDVFPEARPDGPTDPRLDALRARRDALRATVEDIRANATPHASEGERALKALKSRLTNRIADLTDRMARGDFAPKEKKAPTVLDKQAIELEAKLIAAKKEWGAALTRDAWNKKNVVQKAASIAFHTFRDVSRALMTSMDMSVFGRQGSILVNSHPMIGVESFKIGSKALMDPLADAKMEARIHSDPDFRLSRQAGLFIAEHGAGATTPKMEEMMLSRAVEKIPLIGRGVAASQRAYTTALNNIRFQAFKAGLRNLSDGAPSLSAAKAWANFINVATGRGGAPDSRVLNGLSNFFFSPRLVYSRFQFILGQPLWGGEWKGSGAARVLIAKEYGRYVAGLSVFYALAHLANGQIEKDGKVRWGNSVVDPLAGLSQAGKLLSRTVPDLARGVTGQNQRIVKYGQKSAWDYTTDFIRTKLAPLPGAAVNLMTGKTSVGEPTSVKDEALSMVMPMSFRDVYKATKEHGVPKGIALGILSMLGYGLQHYPKRGR